VIPLGTATRTRGTDETPLAVGLLDEVPEHRLGDLEVGDDAVLEGADGGDVAGSAAKHALGLVTDGKHLGRAWP